MSRGLRQGDPLSPLLFLIGVEAMQVMIIDACSRNVYRGLSFQNSELNLSLLQYADDALFFGEWSKSNIKNLVSLLDLFYEVSGLKVNLEKSRLIGVTASQAEVISMAHVIGCKSEFLPISYLGLSVGGKQRNIGLWNEVQAKVKKRLNVWKAKSLSIGGRSTLIKSVLNAIPIFLFSLVRAPMKVINSLEKARRKFFWGINEDKEKINWIAWKKLALPKDQGGLGFGCLKSKNLSLLSKWYWRFITESDALWRKVIVEIYGEDGGFANYPLHRLKGSAWADIVKTCKSIEESDIILFKEVKRKVFNGRSTPFWKIPWNGRDEPLSTSFPRLFNLESNKDCLIADRWNHINGVWCAHWEWRSSPRGRALNDLSSLISDLGRLELHNQKSDTWVWGQSERNYFSVKDMSSNIQANSWVGSRNEAPCWNHWVPIKVNICVWRAMINKLPTRVNLVAKGLDIRNHLCQLCDRDAESVQHVFIKCEHVSAIWKKIEGWWGFNFGTILDMNGLIKSHPGNYNGDKKAIKILKGVMFIAIWCVWRWRNSIIFADSEEERKRKKCEDIFPSIQDVSFLWIGNRCKSIRLVWDMWIQNPSSFVRLS